MFWNEYDLIKDNCEHFARYVTEGQKQSTQVQTFGLVAAWLGLLGIAVFANRGDN
jgi:hypothetical protein